MPLLHALLLMAMLGISPDEYRERRARLRQALPDTAILLMGSADTSSDPRSPLLQEPNFYYLTGWLEPGAVLLILPEDAQPNEILFLPPHNERKERYEGRRAAAGDEGVEKRTGFLVVRSTDIWEAEVARLAPQAKKLSTISHAIARLRTVKSHTEIELLQRAIDVTSQAHLAAWKRPKTDLYEYQLAATMTATFLELGCERPAYRPVVGSGPNSVILHYGANRRRMDRGEVVVMDVGAECASYAADITRTIPVSGRFTARQRELYEVVLGAQKAAIAAVKPGAFLGATGELVKAARDYMDKHDGLGKYFTHGIGHHVGLEVHDAMVPAEPLVPGMVITIEPGIYIPEENIGIRIEDMVLVTAQGGKVLSASLPREAAEIEKRLAK
ncbi:MAG TPA: Xaa-Pro peptidase family protein [Bryobacteraceae bacterium]|nr:Xaa-Pro peptidase family protein [Bryobacteraceae bacterium]